MEKQMEFDFAKESNILEGKTCNTCMHCEGEYGVCGLDSSQVSGDFTCGYYEFNSDRGMEEIAHDAKVAFEEIMDRYDVPEDIRLEIYGHCKWF